MTRAFSCLWIILAAPLRLMPQQPPPVFRAEARLVEVYATVLDHKGRFLDGLPRDRFRITDNGQPQSIVAFENTTTPLFCALLLDTTGSMHDSLPTVKNAMSRVIDEFRDDDSMAIYGFSTSLDVLQDFTRDKAAAKRALLRNRAGGRTALFDMLTNITMDIAGRSGKKAVLAFTDGDDNASVLTAQRAVESARKSGIPIYTVAQGEAHNSQALMKRLREIAKLTGGRSYGTNNPHQAAQIFRDISMELQHTYLIAYKPPASHGGGWHQIKISLSGANGYLVHAKEGYFQN